MRRQSTAPSARKNAELDNEFVQAFLNNRGVTEDDVNNAFELLSRDGRKINKEDIRFFVDKYFGRRLGSVTFLFLILTQETTEILGAMEGRNHFRGFGKRFVE